MQKQTTTRTVITTSDRLVNGKQLSAFDSISQKTDRFFIGGDNKAPVGVSYAIDQVEEFRINNSTYTQTTLVELDSSAPQKLVDNKLLSMAAGPAKALPFVGAGIKSSVNYATSVNAGDSNRREIAASVDFFVYTGNDLLAGAVGTFVGVSTTALSVPFVGPAAPAVGIPLGVGTDYGVGNGLDWGYDNYIRDPFIDYIAVPVVKGFKLIFGNMNNYGY